MSHFPLRRTLLRRATVAARFPALSGGRGSFDSPSLSGHDRVAKPQNGPLPRYEMCRDLHWRVVLGRVLRFEPGVRMPA